MITLTRNGYGHYKVYTIYRGKAIYCITNNMPLIDAYQDDDSKKANKAEKQLRKLCINANKK